MDYHTFVAHVKRGSSIAKLHPKLLTDRRIIDLPQAGLFNCGFFVEGKRQIIEIIRSHSWLN